MFYYLLVYCHPYFILMFVHAMIVCILVYFNYSLPQPSLVPSMNPVYFLGFMTIMTYGTSFHRGPCSVHFWLVTYIQVLSLNAESHFSNIMVWLFHVVRHDPWWWSDSCEAFKYSGFLDWWIIPWKYHCSLYEFAIFIITCMWSVLLYTIYKKHMG